jgi:single-strand DNA-binding protein
MSKSLNKVMLIGHLGKDPELKYLPSGKGVANFSIATSEEWKDGDGKLQERTEWTNVQAWGKLAEICAQYLKKGSRVYVEGSLRTRNYDDKNGVKKYVTEVVISSLLMLVGNKSGADQSDTSSGEPLQLTDGKNKKDDLPF